MAFNPYHGDLIGLPCNEKHLVYRWARNDCKILFSCSDRGNSLSCHFASDKSGLRLLKQAINEWCEYVFTYTSYDKIVAHTGKESINRLITKCGFVELLRKDDKAIYARFR